MAIIIGKNKIVAMGFLVFSLVYLLIPSMWREDWRTVTKSLSGSVYMISSFGDPVKYYDPKIKTYDIRNTIYESKITVIPYGEVIHGVDHNAILTKAGYVKKTEINFRGVTTENWQKI
jgi:hypothetical protein